MYLVHLLHHQFGRRAERDVQHHLLGVENIVVVEQRRVQGVIDGFRHTVFSFTESSTHDGYSAIFQDGFHIGKVKVDRTAYGDNLGNALGGDGKRVVGFTEGIHESKVGVYLTQAFVVDDQQGIYVLGDALHTVQCLDDFLFSFEDKRDGDDADSQDIHLFRDAGNDRSSSGSCSTPHSGSDEHHLGAIVQLVSDIFYTLFGGVACPFGTVAGSKPLCDATAQLQFHRDG